MVAPVTLPTDSAIKLVHAVLILWDHYTPAVQEQAREMLVHLIHELVTSKTADNVLAPRKQRIEQLVEAIRRNELNVVWAYEDNNGKDDDGGASRVPLAMTYLTKEIVDLFSLSYREFSDLWAKEALQWASTCPVRHLACRSFQVFRCISVTLDSRMLADMLARLSNTIADEQTDYQTFSMEILTTLKVIIGALNPDDLLRYPQLFWTTCACLNTIHEREFSEALGMLEKLLERLDMAESLVVQTLMAAKPPKWEGEFSGLQPLVYKGLKSEDSLNRTLLILHRFADLPDNDLTGHDNRLLYSILANLPCFLHEYDLEGKGCSASSCALRLAEVSIGQNCSDIAQCLTAFANGYYRSSSDFLASIVSAVKGLFFPRCDAQSLVFLMGFLTNKSPWFRLRTMEILCALIPEIDMRRPEISCHGPDLISPLLRLLQTDLCPQALEVMDHIMEVSGNPMERHHIRMSLASGSARAIRKEYERTHSLYGIPLSSGWSIPVPAVYSSLTRNNVHAVFYTCGDSEMIQTKAAATPELEFHTDEGYSDSYFTTHRTGTMRSVDTITDANMGDLVHKLDSLDDFFDEPDPIIDTKDSHAIIPNYVAVDMRENGTNIYDQQTAPILHKSLARTASSSSFHNGLAESRPHTSHQQQMPINFVMTPTAFSTTTPTSAGVSSASGVDLSGPAVPVAGLIAARPALHTRSITSPANNYSVIPPTSMTPFVPSLPNGRSFSSEPDSNNYYDDSAVTDSDSSPFPALSLQPSNTTDSSTLSGPGPGILTKSSVPTSISTTDTNGPFSLEGMRRGMRRLTGGANKAEKERDKERIRDMARMRAVSGPGQSGVNGVSPREKMPKVPASYLASAGSALPAASPATSPGI